MYNLLNTMNINIHKHIIIKTLTFFFLFILLSGCNENKKFPLAEKGLLDLRGEDLNDFTKLDGEWELYWDQLLNETDIKNNITTENIELIDVPGLWNEKAPQNAPYTGHATYRLQVLLPESRPNELAIKILNAATSMEVFINGEKIIQSGNAGTNKNASKPNYDPHVADFNVDSDTLNIIAHVSNFHHKKGGLWEPILLGSDRQLSKKRNMSLAYELLVFGALIIMGIYHIVLFFQRTKQYDALYFGLFCLAVSLRITVTGEHSINLIAEDFWPVKVKIEYISFYLAAPLFGLFLHAEYPREFLKEVAFPFAVIGAVLSLFTLLSPVIWFSFSMLPYQILSAFLGLYATFSLILAIIRKQEYSAIMLVGWIIFFITIINDMLYQNSIIFSGNLAYMGLFIFILFKAYIISASFSKEFLRSEHLASDLNVINENLENIVEARTMELSIKNEIIEEHNKDITTGISYAGKIQKALLPDESNASLYFKDQMLLNIPKHIISGDFFWIRKYENKVIIAVADCTGHGVPGAFMSLMGANFLNEITGELYQDSGIEKLQPNIILHRLREEVKQALHQSMDEFEAHDGMDMALCVMDMDSKRLQFSGARRPLYLIQKHPPVQTESKQLMFYPIGDGYYLMNIRGDRMPVGIYLKEMPYSLYTVQLEPGDKIFLFSDGFVDQIGGSEDKKFLELRFKNLLMNHHGKNMEEIKNILTSTFHEWKGDQNEQLDDILIFGAVSREQ